MGKNMNSILEKATLISAENMNGDKLEHRLWTLMLEVQEDTEVQAKSDSLHAITRIKSNQKIVKLLLQAREIHLATDKIISEKV
jgi:hypothetical protein